MPRVALTLTLLAAAQVAAQSSDGGARLASVLDAEGLELSRQGNMREAADRFREACTADPSLAAGHYHFAAAVFGSIRADGCKPAASADEAFEHLARSVQLDKRLLTRLARDPDFEEFRHTAAYFVLGGADVQSAAGVTALLPKLRLHAPSHHDSGPLYRLEFHADGTVDVLDHTFDGGVWSWTKRRGAWKVRSTVTDGGRGVLVEVKAPASGDVPAMKASGRVSAGSRGLVIEGENGRVFAEDSWGVCCC